MLRRGVVVLLALLVSAFACRQSDGNPGTHDLTAREPEKVWPRSVTDTGFELKTVYGIDDRVEIARVSDARVHKNASAVVALVKSERMTRLADGSWRISPGETLGSLEDLCDGQNYAYQPTVAHCTGFVVSRFSIVTARHCVNQSSEIGKLRAVFGYAIPKQGVLRLTFRADQVYDIDWNESYKGDDTDWAVLRLIRRPLPAGQHVLPLSDGVRRGMPVYVLGFPSGIPMKFAANATVKSVEENRKYFRADVDTFHVNSGSPVFDASHQVIGILVEGATDYKPDPSGRPCNVVNVCDASCPGELATRVLQIVGPQSPILPPQAR